MACRGRGGAALPPQRQNPIMCLLPVVSCRHPIHMLCLTSEGCPDAPPPTYARSFRPTPGVA
eukprot:scaffold59360_cov30-Phaeocystis_antarctica.AAC.2